MSNITQSDVRDHAAAWLDLVDRGDGRGSWEDAGATFKSAVTPSSWADQLRAARGPLGPLTSRTLAVEQSFNGLPGAPPGEYVVQQYHAVYDDRKAVVETVTLMREPDGRWRVVGYFIR
jgi:Protein of unknown function (DUF4019)